MSANPTKLLVYLGIVFDHDRKFHAYLTVTDAQLKSSVLPTNLDAHTSHYDVKAKGQRAFMAGSEGMVYRVEYLADTPGTIIPSTATYIDRWPIESDVIRWTAQNRTRGAIMAAKAIRDKASKFNAVQDSMQDVRAAYRRLPAPHRALFLAQLVDYLTR